MAFIVRKGMLVVNMYNNNTIYVYTQRYSSIMYIVFCITLFFQDEDDGVNNTQATPRLLFKLDGILFVVLKKLR